MVFGFHLSDLDIILKWPKWNMWEIIFLKSANFKMHVHGFLICAVTRYENVQ